MSSDEYSRDDLFQLLSNQRRRFALHACRTRETPISLSDLADQVAAWEYDKDVSEISAEERRRVYTSLQQTHLPTMADEGVVTVEDKRVDLADGADAFEVYLEVVPEESIPWGVYYLGLSAVSAFLLVLAAIGVYPDWIPDIAWAGLIVAMFAASAVVHTWRERQSRLGFGDPPPGVDSE